MDLVNKTIDQFKAFWKAYPQRNKKKVGKYPCQLWFEAKKPAPETAEKMIDWLEQDKANRASTEKENGFYAPPCDPLRFLKERMWEDDIGVVLTKADRKAKEAKKTSDIHKQRRIESYISGFENIINSWPINRLLLDKQFRYACSAYPEVKAWALEQRPELKGAKADNPPPPRDDGFTGQSQLVDDFVKRNKLFE